MTITAPLDLDRPLLDRPTARTTALLYLAMGVTGILTFLLVRPRLFAEDDPAATLANLLAHESLARAGIALELGLMIAQVLAALWFYRLFRPVDAFIAGTIVVFGMMNAVAFLVSAAFLATALDVALEPIGEGTSQLMYAASGNLWGVSAVFFGLWLVPMGIATLRSGWAPRALGWLLVAGGGGYLASTFVTYLLPGLAGPAAGALTVPATIAEFWMIGWLLVRSRNGQS